ncbi:MAG: DUF2147 domain-containing protein [Syntrophobacteraceae bacterium]
MPMKITTSLLLAVFFWAPYVYGSDADAILGLWNTMDREAQFEIYKCGEEYCGKISYLNEPNYPATAKDGVAGLPKTDCENPDPQLRNRPLLGLPLLKGFRYTDSNRWEDGRIYNPEDGRQYRCKLRLDGENRLKVRGYLGFSLLGRTETWVR